MSALPRWVRLATRVLVPAARRADVLGDLAEGHASRTRRATPAAARRALRREVAALAAWRLRTTPPLPPSPRPTDRAMLARDLLQDLRIGARALRRRPAFATTTILVLGLGIGAPTTVLSIVDAIFRAEPPQVEAPERLVRIYRSWGPGQGGGSLSHPDYLVYRDGAATFAGLAAYGGRGTAAWDRGEGATAELQMDFASANFFDVLGVDMAAGRAFAADESTVPGGHPVLVVSHAFWREALGGDAAVLGSTLRVNRVPFTVVGVAPPGFRGANPVLAGPDAWAPLAMFGAVTRQGQMAWWERIPDSNHNWLDVVGRLAEGVDAAAAEANLAALARTIEPGRRGPDDSVMVGEGLAFRPGQAATLRDLTRMLLGAVALVLVVALANAAVLLLAWASTRTTELGVRSALGAGRGRMARQLLAEALVLGGSGLIVGVALAWLLADAAGALLPLPLAVSFRPDGHVLAVAAALALLTTLAVGMAPALAAGRGDVRGAIHAGRFQRSGGVLRHGLVVGQVALSLVLVAGAFLFVRSFQAAAGQQLGYATEDRLMVTADLRGHGYDEASGRAFVTDALARLRALPGVESASTMYRIPFSGDWSSDIPVDDGSEETWRLYLGAVSDDYFRTMGIPLLEGRALHAGDRDAHPRAAVVSAALARRMAHTGSAVGRILDTGGDSAVVVGVAADATYYSFGEAPVDQAYFSLAAAWVPSVTFAVHTRQEPMTLAPTVRDILRQLDPELVPGQVTTLDAVAREQVGRYRVSAVLVGVFGLVALMLAGVGLYGVVSFLVARRTREIGVRMALGAGQGRVAAGVLTSALRLTGTGVVLGLVAALWLRRFTTGLLYGVAPSDPLPLMLGALTLLAVAGLAAWGPARRATRVNPLDAMRAE